MQDNKRDISVLKHIIDYCTIEEALSFVENDYEQLLKSNVCKNALALCILQIGELSVVLSDEFKSLHPQMPWRDIKLMRNVVAHSYGSFNTELLWETVTADIPNLKAFYESALLEF
ncbi:MAG: DUF86 domain-containing protein [Eubacteriaceae bacterium]|nr:DUF86 domain-containing protein [Eubacteriaceae bacterium]